MGVQLYKLYIPALATNNNKKQPPSCFFVGGRRRTRTPPRPARGVHHCCVVTSQTCCDGAAAQAAKPNMGAVNAAPRLRFPTGEAGPLSCLLTAVLAWAPSSTA